MDILFVKGKKNYGELIMTVLVPVLMGALCCLLIKNYTMHYQVWSAGKLAPPIWSFGLIWLANLILMGVASYRIKIIAPESTAHVYYSLQLLLAFLWNIIFFRFEHSKISFVIMILYLFSLSAAYFEFDKNDKKSGIMLVSSLVWALILAAVNFMMFA